MEQVVEYMDLNIGEIASVCGGELHLEDPSEKERAVSCVVLDSRKVLPGGVFVATVGERADGHSFIPDVLQKGASLVICTKRPESGNYLLVEDAFRALRELAAYYRKKWDKPVAGITGSVGKTSTKEFVATVLAQKYKVLKTEGNFNNEVGVPLTLLSLRPSHEIAVVEMGISDFEEMHRLSEMVRPNLCVITNIGQCHLEYLHDRDGVLRAKTEIFDYMDPRGEVVLNGEDDKLRLLEKVTLGTRLEAGSREVAPHFFGLGNSNGQEVFATDVTGRGLWGSEAVLRTPEGTLSVQIPLPGAHMVLNSAAAACVGRLCGLNEGQIAEGIRNVKAVGGRTHLVRLPHFTLIDDCYNANPVSMKAAIDLLALADGEKAAILGDMFELGEDSDVLHAEVGHYAAQAGIDRIYCVGANSVHMYRAALEQASRVQDDREQAGQTQDDRDQIGREQIIRYFADREALEEALRTEDSSILPEGGAVLVKASHGMAFEKLVEVLSSQS